MNNKSLLSIVVILGLGVGFLVGAYQSGTSGSNTVKADPYDEPWYRYGMSNNSYYGSGMGMGGMGMCMNGPMGGYGMYNGSYYGGSGMNGYDMYNNSYYYGGMGMMGGYEMMGPMMGNSMYGYGYNNTGYMGMGGCPMMGMMGGYNSMYNYPYQNSAPQSLVDYTGQVVSLADNSAQQTDTQNTADSTSPLLIGGIAIAILAMAPLSWKILQKYKK